jgi:SnoaL-like domain
MTASPLTAARMEAMMRDYYDGCNEADAAKMMRNFTPDGTHYFPPGMYDGPFRGAAKTRTCSAVGAGLAERWQAAVANFGSYWTIDTPVIDERQAQAVTPHLPLSVGAGVEWSHFKTKQGTVLRGAEVVVFDRDSGLIQEIRAYYASPQAPGSERLELGGFDHAGRGYTLVSPRLSEQ